MRARLSLHVGYSENDHLMIANHGGCLKSFYLLFANILWRYSVTGYSTLSAVTSCLDLASAAVHDSRCEFAFVARSSDDNLPGTDEKFGPILLTRISRQMWAVIIIN